MNEKELAFLREYEALCRRHGLAISSCGCCNSPWLVKVGGKDALSWYKEKSGLESVSFDEKSEILKSLDIYFIENGEIKHKKEDD